MEKKQTAVQWLMQELRKPYADKYITDIYSKALQMEREQIEEAYMQGDEDGFHSTESQYDYEAEGRSKHLAEQYYTQTFNQ
jgi:uncharacterized membrane protein